MVPLIISLANLTKSLATGPYPPMVFCLVCCCHPLFPGGCTQLVGPHVAQPLAPQYHRPGSNVYCASPDVAQLASAAGFPVLLTAPMSPVLHGRQWHYCRPCRTATAAPVMLYCVVLLDAGGLAQLTARLSTMMVWCHGGVFISWV